MTARESLEVAAGHPAFAGHFPDHPVLPGAVLLDQVLDVIAQAHALDLARWRLSAAKFVGAILPGESLTVEHDKQPSGAIRFVVHANERAVASGTLSARDGAADVS